MRQIIRQRDIVADAWRYPGEEGDGPQAVTLAAFAAAVAAGTGPMSGAGVWLEPADDVAGLAPQLARVALVVVLTTSQTAVADPAVAVSGYGEADVGVNTPASPPVVRTA